MKDDELVSLVAIGDRVFPLQKRREAIVQHHLIYGGVEGECAGIALFEVDMPSLLHLFAQCAVTNRLQAFFEHL